MTSSPELIALAKQAAIKYDLHSVLICAIVEQESAWNPRALREEPAFYKRYIVPLKLIDDVEAHKRSFSYGLMQVMGQSVRELGFAGEFEDLFDPATGLEWGCKLFQRKLLRAKGDQHLALLYWNGGGNVFYPSQVIDRIAHYLDRSDDMSAQDL